MDENEWAKKKEEEIEEKYDKKHVRKIRKRYLRFLWGGMSGFGAVLYVQPMSLIKIRMQMCSPHAFKKPRPTSLLVTSQIFAKEGIFGFYRGISANVFRQIIYTAGRLGIYNYLFDLHTSADGVTPSFYKKCQFGMIAGAFGSFTSVPAEVAFIRMTADEKLPYISRRHYEHVFDAFFQIIQTEGVLALWRGSVPTVLRGMIVNSASLGVYSEIKEKFAFNKVAKRESRKLHFYSSVIAGFVTCLIAAPIDLVKTRMQCMTALYGVNEYKGTLNAFARISQEEGFFALWKGITPFFFQLIPHTVLVFMFFEELDRIFKGKYIL